MSLIQDKFASVFSQYDVTTQPRPDGGILLTLRNSEGKQVKRSISYQQLHTADQLTWVISAIRRDLAEQASELARIAKAATFAASLGLKVNAGHGLTYHNVKAIARIPEMHELNIGHAIIGRAVMSGLKDAVVEMKRLMLEARG